MNPPRKTSSTKKSYQNVNISVNITQEVQQKVVTSRPSNGKPVPKAPELGIHMLTNMLQGYLGMAPPAPAAVKAKPRPQTTYNKPNNDHAHQTSYNKRNNGHTSGTSYNKPNNDYASQTTNKKPHYGNASQGAKPKPKVQKIVVNSKGAKNVVVNINPKTNVKINKK